VIEKIRRIMDNVGYLKVWAPMFIRAGKIMAISLSTVVQDESSKKFLAWIIDEFSKAEEGINKAIAEILKDLEELKIEVGMMEEEEE